MRTASSGRAFSVVLCVIILAISVAPTCSLALATAASSQADTSIRIPFPISDVSVQVDADGFCEFTGTGIQHLGQTGEPSIPYKSVRVLLPPDVDPTTVKATITGSQWTVIDGSYDVQPAMPLAVGDGESTCAVSPTGEAMVNGRDPAIYESNSLFPSEPVCKVDVQVMRGWKMAQVLYAPFAYNPVEKQVFQLFGNAIEVTFERTSLESSSAGADLTSADRVRELTVNSAEMAGEYGGYAISADTGGYVIITTSAIEAASANLADFVASKEARGFTVKVVTEETWGGGTGDAAAEHIRNWLQANYLTLNIKNVLLVGNPNSTSGDVPMKMCYPQDYDAAYSQCPTDFYYAELTSDWWDRDGDGRYGEYYDDFLANPPRMAEVAVGRIPCYGNISDLDHILSKIIAYETMPETDVCWRRNVLLPMKPSDGSTPGYQLGEEIKDDILIPSGWTYHRIYDEMYGLTPPPETTPCTVTNVTDAWSGSDFGAVFWWTHGSETGASGVMDLSHAATLDDVHPGFAFQCSCSNGAPETSNNLGYSLLRNGCVSTVCASRVSWYEVGQTSFAGTPTNSGMTFEYAKRLIAGEMYAGDALNDLKADISPYHQVLWMNYLDFNLYGCPAVGLAKSPLVTTNNASSITTNSARLNGNLTSLGIASSVTVSFEWGTSSGSYPNETTGEVATITGTLYFNLGSLTPGTTYYYRAKAAGWGTGYGSEKSFTTLTVPPAVTTNDASSVTTTSSRLNGNLTSMGTASGVTVSFVWGTTAGGPYPNETTSHVVTANGAFYFDLGSLSSGITYYYQAMALGDGTSYGAEKSFTTTGALHSWDINQDGKVDYKDLAILGAHYREPTSEPYPAWDINQDGKVDYKDLAILGAHYGDVY